MQTEFLPDVIAIDGPAASGKSTVGLMLAKELGYLFLDTGLMYRALTLAALERGIDSDDEAALATLAVEIDLDVLPLAGETDGRHYTVLLDGQDVTWDLRSPVVDATVSKVSAYPAVREEMVRRQRLFGHKGRVVMVGRDIGTVVMPEAPFKLYITASPEERAGRRLIDREQLGEAGSYEAILADVVRRDHIDSNREHSPLRPADDAIVIDTTGRPVLEVFQDILGRLNITHESV